MNKKLLIFLIIIFLTLSSIITYIYISKKYIPKPQTLGTSIYGPIASPTTTEINGRQKVKYPHDYTIVLLGDSMTERLGNADELRAYLKGYYPKKSFEVLNYGYGSTNILSAQDRLEKTTYYSRDFRPILDIAFDLILIESFGHNPLSQYQLKEGLKKQNEALDEIIRSIESSNPRSSIVFVATLAPNKSKYALNQVDLTPEKRKEWAKERESYIKNHIQYAKSKNIPLIDVYHKSLNIFGDGEMDFINKADYIHPSPKGIYLISKTIADFIYKQKLLK